MSNKNLNKKFNAEIDAKTKQYQKIHGFEISSDPKHPTWNNEADAFKHAFMQAILAQRYTIPMSLVAGWFHEITEPLKDNQWVNLIWIYGITKLEEKYLMKLKGN